MWPLEATLDRPLNKISQSLNIYNGLDVLHFVTLKHATTCVKKNRTGQKKKKILLNTGILFLAQGRKGGNPCSICQVSKKTVQMLV